MSFVRQQGIVFGKNKTQLHNKSILIHFQINTFLDSSIEHKINELIKSYK